MTLDGSPTISDQVTLTVRVSTVVCWRPLDLDLLDRRTAVSCLTGVAFLRLGDFLPLDADLPRDLDLDLDVDFLPRFLGVWINKEKKIINSRYSFPLLIRGSLYKSAKLIYLLIKWQKKLKQNAYSICIFILIESFYLRCTVLQVFPWLPWIIFCPVTLPSDQVLYHTFPFPLLKDFVNLQRQNILSNYSNTVSSVWLDLQSTLKVILHVMY